MRYSTGKFMKKSITWALDLLGVTMFCVILSGCKKDPTDFLLNSLITGTTDIHVSSPPVIMSASPIIVASFNSNVDSKTADSSNITLIRDYDNYVAGLIITSQGTTITITPAEALGPGSLYRLILKAGLKSEHGLAFTEASFSFTTPGTFVPTGAIAYWNFEDNANDQIGNKNPTAYGIVDIAYTESRNTAAGKAASFNGTTSIIEIPKGDILMNSPNFTLSFWVKTISRGLVDESLNPAGFFVIGLGAFFGFEFEISADFGFCNFTASYDTGGGAISEDLTFLGDGKNKDNGGWQGWEFCRNLTGSGGVAALLKDKWAQVVYMYEATSKRGILYINGEKMKVINFNLWPEGNDRRKVTGMKYSGNTPETVNELAFGFIQSRAGTFYDSNPKYGYDFPGANHFQGQLDDVRIFHEVLTETEIQLMYNSEK